MMMLPPVMISLPFKLLLFVLVDGLASRGRYVVDEASSHFRRELTTRTGLEIGKSRMNSPEAVDFVIELTLAGDPD